MGYIFDDRANFDNYYVQIKPNKYDCPDCGKEGMYIDKYKKQLCMKCAMKRKRKGMFW